MNNLPPPYYPYQAGWQNPAYPVYPVDPSLAPPVNPYAMPAAYPAAPMAASAPPARANTLTNPRFIKGALIGAVAAYLLTNENVQQAVIKGTVKAWSMVQGGVEEMKERFRDAEAELHAAEAMEPDAE